VKTVNDQADVGAVYYSDYFIRKSKRLDTAITLAEKFEGKSYFMTSGDRGEFVKHFCGLADYV
jgi:hypothetical protein